MFDLVPTGLPCLDFNIVLFQTVQPPQLPGLPTPHGTPFDAGKQLKLPRAKDFANITDIFS